MSSNAKSWKRYLSPRFLASKVREEGIIWEPETTESLINEFTDVFRQIDIAQWEQNFDELARAASARIGYRSKDIGDNVQ